MPRPPAKFNLPAGFIFFWPCLLLAQGMPASPVRYTEAQEVAIPRSFQITGNIRAHRQSVIAAEAAGIVARLLVREGDQVQEGDVILQLRTTTLELQRSVAEAGVREAQASLALALSELERVHNLFERKIATQQDLDQATAKLRVQEATVSRLNGVLSLAEDALERATVKAPFSGTVTRRHTDLGSWLSTGAPCVDLLTNRDLEVIANIPEQYAPFIQTEMTVSVAVDAAPNSTIRAEIQAIIPETSMETRTFPVRIKLLDPPSRVTPGMLCRVKLVGSAGSSATIVPKDAIISQGPQQFVFTIDQASQVAMVPVATGQAFGEWIAIDGQVGAGAKIITRGNERVQPGQAVEGTILEYELPSL